MCAPPHRGGPSSSSDVVARLPILRIHRATCGGPAGLRYSCMVAFICYWGRQNDMHAVAGVYQYMYRGTLYVPVQLYTYCSMIYCKML